MSDYKDPQVRERVVDSTTEKVIDLIEQETGLPVPAEALTKLRVVIKLTILLSDENI